MVIAHLIGGLGNQMFQYAAARALSSAKKEPLLLDTSSFESYTLHQGFELSKLFAGEMCIARDKDVNHVLSWQAFPRIRNFLHRPKLAFLRKASLIIEPSFHYWNGIQKAPADCYLMGYWQSERYFQDAAEEIRKDFTFKLNMSPQNIATADQILNTNAISLHVRRGDYVNNSVYAACTVEYYQAAIQLLSKRVDAPTFFVFSDDIDWVKNNLNIGFPHCYVNHNKGSESYNDMRLMSMCQHNIIANSSFSWWGAWLNLNVDKIVVAPKQWFINNTNVNDLFPPAWVTL